MKKLKLQCVYYLIFTVNLVSKFLVFFYLRKLWLGLWNINLGKRTAIHSTVKFTHISNFSIGNNSTVNNGCLLDNRKGIYIGDNVNISHNSKIYTLGHDIDCSNFKAKGASVYIDDYVCIFSNVLICPGVSIGKGAVVMPGSVVVKDILEYEVVGGNPAKFIRYRNKNLTYKLDHRYWLAI